MRWQARLRKRSNSSTPIPDSGFTPFWEKAETTGIMKLKELLCPKHFLQAWKSEDGKIYAYICVDCETAFYVKRENFVRAWTREDSTWPDDRDIYVWEVKELRKYLGLGDPRDPGVLRQHNGDPTPA